MAMGANRFNRGDRVAFDFHGGGINATGIEGVVEVVDRLCSAERRLYDGCEWTYDIISSDPTTSAPTLYKHIPESHISLS